MMPKFNVLKDFKGSPDGHTVIEYKKGETAEMEGDLAKVALEEKWVKPSKSAEKDAKAKTEAAAQREADIAALQTELAQLKADYDAATSEDDKAEVLAQAETKQAELDALLA